MIDVRLQRSTGDDDPAGSDSPLAFRRISSLPPYVFAEIEELKRELRRAGEDVIDLGFGNPDLPSPPVAVSST